MRFTKWEAKEWTKASSRKYRRSLKLVLSVFLFISLISSGLFLTFFKAHADTTSNILGWWKLDEGSGSTANDSSGNGLVGTLASMTGVTWTTGILGGALNFASTTDFSNAYVNVGSPASVVALSSQVSISVWIKADDFSNTRPVVCRDPFGDGVFCLGILSTGKPQWYLYQSNGTKITLSPSNVLSTGQWYNIVAVADGSVLRMYINGVDTGVTASYNGTLFSQPAVNGRSLTIGASGFSVHFHGTIDDARLYNGTLTSSDANSLYVSGIQPNVTIQVATSTDTTATLNATIVSNQAASSTVRGFIYGTDTTFSTGTTTETGTFNPGIFTASISGLTCGTVYHVKAYAMNSFGTTTTNDQPFEACVTDSDLQAYISGVYSNAGTMSSSTQSAMATFISNLKAHGSWSKLIAVGPLAGDQLSAALIQLKYLPGTSQRLANHNFISADYSPMTGLQGSSTASSVKWLDSGLNEATTFPSAPLGLAFWSGNNSNIAQGNRVVIGIANSVGSGVFQLTDSAVFNPGGSRLANYPFGNNKIPVGFIHGEQSSATTSLYVNGVLAGASIAGSYVTKNSNIGILGDGGTSNSGDSMDYYSFDDGSMSSVQVAQYYDDVRQLMIGLGRISIVTNPMKMAIITGQSLGTGSNGTPILSTIQPYNNRMFLDGSWYGSGSLPLNAALTPLTEYNGAAGETISTAMANFVSSSTRSLTPGDSSQDLVMENVAEGGWNYAELALGAEGATGPFAISTSTISKLKILAASQYTTGGVAVPGVLVVHGESNEWDPAYQADIRQWQKDYDSEIKKITGQAQDVRLFHSQTSDWTIGATAPFDMLVQSEIDPTRTLLVAPKYFFQYGSGANGIHLTNVGYRWLGEYYGKAWFKAVVLGQTWSPLRPISEVLNGQNIDITFTGNVGNIVFSTTTDGTTSMPTAPNYGFEYYDDATSSSISSVSITGSNSVRVTLSQVPTGPNKRIRYAYTCSTCTAGGPGNGPYGNLRDSDPTVGNSDGLPLWDWAVHFDKRLGVVMASAIATPATSSVSITVNSGMTASSTRIFFGPSTNYGTSTSKILNSLSSSFTLSTLKPCTIYHYMASSTGPSTLSAPQYDYVPGYATTTIYDLTSGSVMSISDTGTSTDQNFTTTGCTGNASVISSSTNMITTGSGGSLALGVLSLTVPTSYSGTTTTANFQAKKLDPTAFATSAGVPSGKLQAGTNVVNLEALIDATTTLPTFSQPLTVVMSYSPSDITGISESSLKIYRYDGSSWSSLTGCSVDTGAKTVTCQTSNFSDFGIFGDSAAATTFTFAGPSSGNAGSASTNFTVTPNGPYTGTITLTPSGSGSTGLSATVLTFSNSSAAQTFTITPTVAGTVTLTPTNNQTLTNPSNLSYTVNAVVPGQPTSVSAATSTPNQATITFSTPAFNGGSSILYYLASSTPGNFTGTSSGSPITVSGLTNGTSYTFAVYAVNAAGTSTPSSASNAVTPIGVPGVPTGVTATAGNTQAIVNFSAPASNGGSNITGYTVVSSPAGGTDSNAGSAALTHTVTGLANGTPYTFTVTATNAVGTGSASSASNSVTPSTIASVSTNTITNIASTSATLSGSIASTGGSDASQRGFAYGTVADLSTVTATTTLGSQTGTGTFTQGITGLTSHTTYYVRAYAVNAAGTTTGSILSFLTLPAIPAMTTQAPTPGSGIFFTANGTITATGGVNASVRGFVYGTGASYGATTTENGSFGTGSFTATITGVACNTLYHVASYSTNTGGTGYGSDQTITTSVCAKPTLTATSSDVTTTSATLNGSMIADGNASSTIEGFNWGTDTNYGQQVSSNGTFGIGSFIQSLSGLACATAYHFQAFATNIVGTGTSTDQSFMTGACVSVSTPTVTPTVSSGGGGSASSQVSNLLSMGFPDLARQVAKQYNIAIPANLNIPSLIPLSNPGSSFTRTLRAGATNSDVKKLQVFLNVHGFTVSKSGAGSPGHETTYFGPATKAALMNFQLAYKKETLDPQGLKAPTGFFGVDTMKTVNALLKE